MMQKWEYLIVDTNNVTQASFSVIAAYGNETVQSMQNIEKVLPYLGEHGWELVFCYPLKALSINGQRMIFKRPKS